MTKITAIKAQKRNQQRVNIYIDGEYHCAVYRITAAWLQVGQELSEEQITVLLTQDAHEAAYQKAIRLLERRERTSTEIEHKLQASAFSEEIINSVINRLQENGLVDDNRFAHNWVDARKNFRPRSRRALVAELRNKGVEEAIINKAVANVDEEAMACQVAHKYSRKLQTAEWPEFRQKLGAFLIRRGFGFDVSKSVTRHIWNEKHSEKDDFLEESV